MVVVLLDQIAQQEEQLKILFQQEMSHSPVVLLVLEVKVEMEVRVVQVMDLEQEESVVKLEQTQEVKPLVIFMVEVLLDGIMV